MCVVAHPDDECFAFGGVLALAGRAGVETYCICLTDGQAATNRGESADAADLGRMRREEFAASCAVLGVSRYELLDYQDGQLEFVEFSVAAGRLVAKMREYRPDVVVTFGADGAVNTHADHTMVSLLTTAAFHWAGLEKRYPEMGAVHLAARLYTLSPNFFMEGRPAPAPAPWTVRVDVREVMGVQQEAFRQHASQAPLMEKTKDLFAEFGCAEFFTLAAQREIGAAGLGTGLFEGLR